MTDDVIDLILEDHRTFEDLFRGLRDRSSDRRALLAELSNLLVAHAEAEEREVYPALERFRRVDDQEVEHGAEEHAEGHQALSALLEVSDTSSEEWEERLEELVETINHHLDEEERTILNQAREAVSGERRVELGSAFSTVRRDLLGKDIGAVESVREVVRRTEVRVD